MFQSAAIPIDDDDNPFEDEDPIITTADDSDSMPIHTSAHTSLNISSADSAAPSKKKNAYLTSVTSYFQEQKERVMGNSKKPSLELADASSGDDLSVREANLKAREAQILAKEREIDELKRKVADGTVRVKNWPLKWSFFAITYHDISEDVLPVNQQFVRYFYRLLLYEWFCIVFNFITVIFGIGLGCNTSFLDIVYNCVYAAAGLPGSWLLWYQPTYDSGKFASYSAIAYARFMCGFFCHGVWAVLMFAGFIPGGGGIIIFIAALGSCSYVYVIVDLICTGLWGFNILFSLWMFRLAYTKYRAGGGSISSLRTGVIQAAATAAVS